MKTINVDSYNVPATARSKNYQTALATTASSGGGATTPSTTTPTGGAADTAKVAQNLAEDSTDWAKILRKDIDERTENALSIGKNLTVDGQALLNDVVANTGTFSGLLKAAAATIKGALLASTVQATTMNANSFIGDLVGNAATATKLKTPRTIWGQNFDGSGNVDGTLYTTNGLIVGEQTYSLDGIPVHGVIMGHTMCNAWNFGEYGGQYNFYLSKYPTTNASLIARIDTNNNYLSGSLGIGTTSPAYKLDVNGNFHANGGRIDLGMTVNGSIIATGNVGIGTTTPQYKLDVNGNMRVTSDLYSDATVGTSNFASRTTGWRADSNGNADFRNLYADELRVQAFTADISQALAGSDYLTKSVSKLSANFVVPSVNSSVRIIVDDIEGMPATQCFANGDYVRFRVINRTAGLTVANAWGTVTLDTSYGSNGFLNGTQAYTFTCKATTGAGLTVFKGSEVLDYGTNGSGLIARTTLDAQGSPYTQIATWVTDPSVSTNYTVHARLGNLGGIANCNGYGLYTDNGFFTGKIVIGDLTKTANFLSFDSVNGLQIKLGGTSVATTTDVSNSLTTANTNAQRYANTAQTNAINTASGDATNKVNAVQIGGRNLARSSKGNFTYSLLDISNYSPTMCIAYWVGNKSPNIVVSGDVEYSNIVFTGTGSTFIRIQGSQDIGAWKAGLYFDLSDKISEGNGKFHFSFATSDSSILNNNYWNFGFRSDYITGTITFKNLSVVYGTKEMSWSPAPEDVDASISTAQSTAISTAASNAAALYVTQTAYSSQVNILKDSINAKVSQTDFNALGTRVGTAESNITQNANAITTKVSQTTFDALGTRVSTAETAITQNTTDIGLKVSKDGVIGAINLTSEAATINASKINLIGAVTFSTFSSDLQTSFNDKASVSSVTTAQNAANAAQTSADSANSAIANIVSDNVLSANEKGGERDRWNVIASEKSGIDAQATIYGITTEKTAYDTAFQTLATYLNNGTAWSSGIPSWITDANLSVNTTVDGTTYRSKWQAYFDARTALLNAIYAKAKLLADNAQGSANTAIGNAATAQTTAANAATAASNAQSSANTANSAIADMASDDKITAPEKQAMKTEWDSIVSEKTKNDTQADNFGVSRTTYDNSYSTLSTTIGTNLSNLTTTWDLGSGGGATLRSQFKAYYDARTELLNNITTAAKKAAIDASAEDATNKVNAIQIGGRNLLQGTKDFKYGNNGGTLTANDYLGFTVSSHSYPTSGYFDFIQWGGIAPTPNTYYTLSFYAKSTNSGDVILSYFYPDTQDGPTDGRTVSTLTDTWKRYIVVWHTNNSVSGFKNVLVCRLPTESSSGTVSVCGVKLEEGNKATTWTPAPEDVDANINAAQTTATNAATAASNAQTSANTANSAIAEMTSDDKVTAQEKQAMKTEWDSIVSEKIKNDTQADNFGVSRTTYDSTYSTLSTTIGTNLSNLTTTWDLGSGGGATLRSQFKAYYDARTDLLNSISTKAKTLADAAKTAADNAQGDATNALNRNNTMAVKLGYTDYTSLASAAALGHTLIDGGMINTVLINATAVVTNGLTANCITANMISSGAVTADKIAANTITADKIAANTITANKIAANTITGDQINATSVSASIATVISLDASRITTGKLSADRIDSVSVVTKGIEAQTIDAKSATISNLNVVNASVSGTLNGVSGTFNSLQGVGSSGRLVFGTYGMTFEDEDISQQGTRNGRTLRYYANNIRCRGSFGASSINMARVHDTVIDYYVNGDLNSYVRFNLQSNGVGGYYIPLYPTSDSGYSSVYGNATLGDVYGFPVDLVIFDNSAVYNYELVRGNPNKKVTVINAHDGNIQVNLAINGNLSWALYGGAVQQYVNIRELTNPVISSSVHGAGWLMLSDYDNNWA